MTEARASLLADARKKTMLAIAGELIASLREPASFWRAFKSVKLDTADSDGYAGERVVVIVAKGDAADRLSDAYDDAMQYEQTIEGLRDA